MSENVSFNDNYLYINSKAIKFEFPLLNAIVLADKVVVALDVPDDSDMLDNIIAFDFNGQPVWKVQAVNEKYPEIKNNSPFVGISKNDNGNVSASNYFGLNFEISAKDGKILSKNIGR